MQNKYGEQLKFYADRQKDAQKRTALDVQYVESLGKEKALTLNVSLALMDAGTTAVDWNSKITIQLSSHELTSLCGVLFGLEADMKAKFHGDSKNKGLTVMNNGPAGCGVNISQAGQVYTHMLDHAKRIELGAFVLRRQAQAWQMSVSDVLAILRQSVAIRSKPR